MVTKVVKQRRKERNGQMNVYVAAGAVCLAIWGVLVYGTGIGAGPVHAIVAVGFLLVARGLIAARRT